MGKKYAFYISGHSTRLYKFLLNIEDTKDIVLVVSDRKVSKEIEEVLCDKGIKLCIFLYAHLKGNTNKERNLELSNKILKEFRELQIDYCFSFGSHLLAGDLLIEYKNKLINFHPAILPMFPGRKAIDQAYEHGNTFLVGNTAHFIDEGMDTGAIIMQSVVPIRQFEVTRDYDYILDIQVEMLIQLKRAIGEGRLYIQDGKSYIDGADYSRNMIYPYFE